jgi:D-sedoheptulose 7-phosphate isomerase
MTSFTEYIAQFDEVLKSTIISDKNFEEIRESRFNKIVEQLLLLKKNNRTVYLVGNGGSSGIISHVSIDLINACKIKAHPITDNSIITCLANDYGYERVFSEALSTLITEGDILIAVSSSGNSQNIINAVNTAKNKLATTITLSGFSDENPLRKTGDYNLWIDSSSYGFVEIGHALLLHFITDSIISLKTNL